MQLILCLNYNYHIYIQWLDLNAHKKTQVQQRTYIKHKLSSHEKGTAPRTTKQPTLDVVRGWSTTFRFT
jgi:hypothetical protein